MLNKFKEVFALPAEERQELFLRARKELQIRESYIEKDFWTCLTLEILFNHRPLSSPHLLFKGGTSLSKVYKAVNRFSEDIDITVFSSDLGMNADEVEALGSKKKDRFLKELSKRCDEFLFESLMPALKENFEEVGASDVVISPFADHTIFVKYPSLFEETKAGYVEPKLKIESGARSAVDPHIFATVIPYTQSVLDLGLAVQNVCTIKAERTFCDKVIILHGLQSGYEKENRIPKSEQRVARHYFDLAMLGNTQIGESAIQDKKLQESARHHASLMFSSGWRGYDTARPGQYCIVPEGELLRAVESDYRAMEAMIYGPAPEFEQLITTIQELEHLLNDVDPIEVEPPSFSM